MKLLYCRTCGDIVKLLRESRPCACGLSTGAYVNDRDVAVSGPAWVMGIPNMDMAIALQRMTVLDIDAGGTHVYGPNLTAFFLYPHHHTIQRT